MLNPLDRYSTLLMDLNGTIMFNQDRFGPDQHYIAAYRRLGGHVLPPRTLNIIVECCRNEFQRLDRDPTHYEDFPTVRSVLERTPASAGLPPEEIDRLERVIAWHEIGHIPPAYVMALGKLSSAHTIVLISNVWSRSRFYREALGAAGVVDCFAGTVFSSDGPAIKPAPAIFQRALSLCAGEGRDTVMIGNSLRCDVAGARAVDIDAIWINPSGVELPPQYAPVAIVRSLLELVS